MNWESWDFSEGLRAGDGSQIRVGLELRRDPRFPPTKTVVLTVDGPEQRALLAHVDARPLRERPLVRGSALARHACEDESDAMPLDRLTPARAANQEQLARAADRGEGARRRPARGGRHAGRARRAAPRQRVSPVRRRSPRSQPARRGAALSRLELRARPGAGRPRSVEAAVPDCREPLSRARRQAAARFGRPGPRERRARAVLEHRRERQLRRRTRALTRSPAGSPALRTSPMRRCSPSSRGSGSAEASSTTSSRRARTARRSSSFVTRTKAGYCQHYAGAMARDAAPARDPRSGRGGLHERDGYDDGKWVVTDHEAHAWVEVWFAGQGWVPFDPTPGRGTFGGTYSFASDSKDAVEALRRGDLSGETPIVDRERRELAIALGWASSGRARGPRSSRSLSASAPCGSSWSGSARRSSGAPAI